MYVHTDFRVLDCASVPSLTGYNLRYDVLLWSEKNKSFIVSYFAVQSPIRCLGATNTL